MSPRATSLQSVAERAGVFPIPQSVIKAIDSVVMVTGVSLDSRAILPGDLYAALPGANAHGARFVGAAVGLGAVAVLTDPAGEALLASGEAHLGPGERGVPVLVVPQPRAVLGDVAAMIYGHGSEGLTMLGITGTNGKTTTAYLLDAALRALGQVTGLISTVETRIGADHLKSTRTTPESTDLHALFAVMLERGVDTCTMEVSSHALALHRIDGVRYDVAAFINLSQDHLDFHGTMESYYLAKASLFTPERAARAVVCVDDEWGRRLAAELRESGESWESWESKETGEGRLPVVTLSSRPDVTADWQIQPAGADGAGFDLVAGARQMSLRSALPGDFNRVNTAVAALMLLAAGHPVDAIEAALAADPEVPGRMETVSVPGVPEVPGVAGLASADQARLPLAVVDFAHTPGAVAAALKALRQHTAGSLVVVLGAGGDRDPGKRAAMGAAAAAHADVVIVTDDNPRSENPATIRAAVLGGALEQARSGQSQPGRIREVGDRATAIREAAALAGAGDTVVVLGKGHESGQDIAGVVHPFDDRDQLRAALMERVTAR